MKKGEKVIINNSYDKKELRGKEGIILRIIHDKDCIYAQSKWAEVKFENDKNNKFIQTCFLNEVA